MAKKINEKDPKSMDKLPKVLFVGPQRTGTTWIYEYLRARGDIVLPKGVKETWFFSHFLEKGVSWYASHFKPHKPFNCIVEVDPTLFSHPEAPKRVYDVLGSGVTIICTLRDPVKRSISHYLHARRYGWTKKPLEEAISELPSIIDESRYAKHIARWISVFGRERVHILFQEELTQDPDAFVANMCRIMRIPYIPIPNRLKNRVNKAMSPRCLPIIRLGYLAVRPLRSRQLYWAIKFFKNLGLSRFLYRSLRKEDILPTEAQQILVKELQGEVRALRKLLGRKVPFAERTE